MNLNHQSSGFVASLIFTFETANVNKRKLEILEKKIVCRRHKFFLINFSFFSLSILEKKSRKSQGIFF